MITALDKIIKNIKPKYDDDCIDRLNYAYTSGFFVILILVIGAKQYVGEPLQCWMNAEFKGPWEKYIEDYCFVENTYYVSFDNERLPAQGKREAYELRYYQWVPIILTLQLLLLLVPKTFWSAVSWKTGLNVRAIIGNLSHAERQKKLMAKPKNNDEHSDARNAAKYLRSNLEYNKKRKDLFMGILPNIMHSNYLTIVYLFYKLLNFLNTFIQLYIMNNFINTSYTFWGIGILNDLISNRDWKSSGNFPRVTYCDFMRRDDTSSKPMLFTVQCVLMINMFNEKLYIVLWFWFLGLTILNFGNLLFWLISSFVPAYSKHFIKAQLNFSDNKDFDEKDVPDFINDRIPRDGITALRLVAANAGDLISSDCISMLYDDWNKNEKKNKFKSTDPMESETTPKKRDPMEPEMSKKGDPMEPKMIPAINGHVRQEGPPLPPKEPVVFEETPKLEPLQLENLNELLGDDVEEINPISPSPIDFEEI